MEEHEFCALDALHHRILAFGLDHRCSGLWLVHHQRAARLGIHCLTELETRRDDAYTSRTAQPWRRRLQCRAKQVHKTHTGGCRLVHGSEPEALAREQGDSDVPRIHVSLDFEIFCGADTPFCRRLGMTSLHAFVNSYTSHLRLMRSSSEAAMTPRSQSLHTSILGYRSCGVRSSTSSMIPE